MYFVGVYPSASHFFRSGGVAGSVNSAETDVGPAAATSERAEFDPYRSATFSSRENASQLFRYVESHGIGKGFMSPSPGPYLIGNVVVTASFKAH